MINDAVAYRRNNRARTDGNRSMKMKHYIIRIINKDGKMRTKFKERVGRNYLEIPEGDEPLELRKIAENNYEMIKNFGMNKWDLKITINSNGLEQTIETIK